MNEENNDDDLEAFENQFYGTPEPEKGADEERENQEEVEEEVVEEENIGDDDNPPAPDETDEDDDAEEPEEEEESEEDEDEPKANKKNRKSFQERINELTAQRREAERREAALLKRLDELEAAVKQEKEPEKTPLREQLPADAPHPDAVDKDGEPLYALGEFDPEYIRDLTKFTIEQETKAAREREQKEAQERAIQEQLNEVRTKWVERVDALEDTEEFSDIRERIAVLGDTFQNIEPAYGEYLATTIMSSEVGPQLMYYLSQNIGEAQQIVASGPAAATLALGRLEARMMKSTEQEPKRNKKVSTKAPPPPEERTRGANGRFAVPPDTDDLDAFERVFLSK